MITRLQVLPTEAQPAPPSLPAMSVIAHELRAPLSSLAAASELLVEDLDVLDPQQVRQMVQVIHDGTHWLQGLVENLLCAAALQAGRFQIQPEPLSLLDVAVDVQPVVTPLLHQKGQRLQLAADANLPPVAADRRWIGQTLVNLIANASKYSGPSTPISVRITRRNGCVRTTVADRGAGLPQGRTARLFEPFVRGAGAAEADRGGAGLGLAIVKGIVEAHGGQVGARNRPKGGACLWFELAALPSEPAGRASPRQPPGERASDAGRCARR